MARARKVRMPSLIEARDGPNGTFMVSTVECDKIDIDSCMCNCYGICTAMFQ
jgi:hypothetical protein